MPEAEAGALLPRAAALLGDAFPVLRRVRAVAQAPRLQSESRLDRSNCAHACSPPPGAGDPARRPPAAGHLHRRFAVGRLRQPRADRRGDATARRTGASGGGDLAGWRNGRSRRRAAGRRRAGGSQTQPVPRRRRAAHPGRPTPAWRGERAGGAVAATGVGSHQRQRREHRRRGEGPSLFIQELVRHAQQHGDRQAVPLLLDDVLWARVLELPPAARSVLELAAVAGTPIAHEVMARAVGPASRPSTATWRFCGSATWCRQPGRGAATPSTSTTTGCARRWLPTSMAALPPTPIENWRWRSRRKAAAIPDSSRSTGAGRRSRARRGLHAARRRRRRGGLRLPTTQHACTVPRSSCTLPTTLRCTICI